MRPMKHIFAVVLAVALAGCASAPKSDNPQQRVPEVEFAQLVGPSDVQATGPFDVKFGMRVTNPSTQPITLRRVELRQIGSGTYVLARNNNPVVLKEIIEPGGSIEISFWQHAIQRVLPGSFGASEPVSLRVVSFFDTPTGHTQSIKQVVLGQFN